jgi:iron complex transport system ATP-binding protein
MAGLTVSIAGQTVCRGLELDIVPGEVWTILGRNGAGKTTLLHTVAGLRRPDSGTVCIGDLDLHGARPQRIARVVGVLFQDYPDPFPATVLETALVGRHPFLRPWSAETGTDREAARTALGRVGMTALAERTIQTLSGGERRRLAIATVLVQGPAFYLLDEPTNHLDVHHQIGMLAEFRREAAERGAAVVMVLHDVNLAVRFADRALLLFGDGEVAHGPVAEVVRDDTLSRLYHHPVISMEFRRRRVFVPE